MPVCTVLEKKGGCVVGAELTCSVKEENPTKKERYTADWRSINMKTQPEDRQSMLMSDDSRRETLSRYWQIRPLNQACPSGVLRVGTVDTGVREHQLLPYRNTLPLPIFKPAELGIRLSRGAPHTLEDLPPARVPDGACPDKRPVEQITRDLPPVKPMRMEFAKHPEPWADPCPRRPKGAEKQEDKYESKTLWTLLNTEEKCRMKQKDRACRFLGIVR